MDHNKHLNRLNHIKNCLSPSSPCQNKSLIFKNDCKELESKVKEYTMDDLKKHNKEGDLWILIKGKIYDVSEFMIDHPVGGDLLLDVAGKDATKGFDEAGHSNEALAQLEELYIGELKKEVPQNSKNKKKCIKKQKR
eukprot:TRINITY_DN5950_c0_g1_i1.p1 TRINITY_DN5950_c0_g1~~TRINITY_DN5950_c0_g1_i1.p1  ORF type:complete len:137 (+),score=41.50 TRINITY_DN5950_c0_g1_i1:2-412(+)